MLAAAGRLARLVDPRTATDAPAYFSTFARAWELALGAALAIAAPTAARSARPGSVSLSICTAAVAFSDSTPFPGYAALLPTIGAALVIAAAPGSASRLLSLAPFRYVGDRSYAFYLWHWPALVIAAGTRATTCSTAGWLGLWLVRSSCRY